MAHYFLLFWSDILFSRSTEFNVPLKMKASANLDPMGVELLGTPSTLTHSTETEERYCTVAIRE